MSGQLFLFPIRFVIGLISYQKNNQKKFRCLYLGQRTAGEATFASPVGPRHKTGAARKAVQPLIVQKKNNLESIKTFSISWLYEYPII